MGAKIFLFGIVLMLILPIAYGATITGTVYDISLDKISDARVVIDTTPKQTFIAKNGTYAFEVPTGNYTLRAEHYIGNSLESFGEENLLVKDDGRYVIDLILFPNFAEEDELLKDTEELDISTGLEEENGLVFWIIGVIAILIVIGAVYYFKKGKKLGKKQVKDVEEKPKEEKIDDFTDKVLDVIKKQGGRTTQKDIRKQIPFSEAKISLIIAELEHKGLVQKIKKGRGNIIILKK